ncbi:MAG: MMPL family transporter, partial [Spirochaetota bacterium]
SKALSGVGRFSATKPGVTIAVSLALVIGIGVFAPRVTFETNTLNSFKAGTEIRRASEYLNENFSGITVMTVIVRTAEDGAVLEPAVLRAVDRLQTRLEGLRLVGDKVVAPGQKGYEKGSVIVGGSQSIVTFVKGINKALNADNPAFDKVPDDVTPVPITAEKYSLRKGLLEERDSESGALLATYGSAEGLAIEGGSATVLVGSSKRRIDLATGKAVELVPGRDYVGQLVFQYENSGKPENIEGFIDNPRRTARVNVFIRSASSDVLGQVQTIARGIIKEDFPGNARADITGLSNLTLVILRLLVQSQISSVLSSLVICFIFIALVARNIVEGVFSIIPLTASLIINFGTMAIFSIPIDMSTATIASIGIGIGIDYTCHFIEGLKQQLCKLPLVEAIEETMRTTGKGIFVNALAVAVGFAALLLSQLRGNIFMGILMALIMLTSSAFAVTLLPSLLVVFKPKFVGEQASKARCEDAAPATPAA